MSTVSQTEGDLKYVTSTALFYTPPVGFKVKLAQGLGEAVKEGLLNRQICLIYMTTEEPLCPAEILACLPCQKMAIIVWSYLI